MLLSLDQHRRVDAMLVCAVRMQPEQCAARTMRSPNNVQLEQCTARTMTVVVRIE